MHLKHHLILTLILCILLFPVFKKLTIIILLAGFLIDTDHYLEHIFSHNTLSLKKAYNHYTQQTEKKVSQPLLHVFHSLEFLILILILSFYSIYFRLILIGVLFHQLLDIITLIHYKRKYPEYEYKRSISILDYALKRIYSLKKK